MERRGEVKGREKGVRTEENPEVPKNSGVPKIAGPPDPGRERRGEERSAHSYSIQEARYSIY